MAQLPVVNFPGLLRRLLLGTTALLPATMAQAQAPNAVPTGGQVSAGQATITQSGTQTQVTQGTNRAVVDWQRFDVGRNSTVNFTQPNAQSWTLNRVTTPDPSLIAGRITANGGVAIVNQSGVVFTPGSQVNVGSLIASTANVTNQNFMAGRMEFNERGRAGARVENHGSITVADRGLAALVGPGAANTGTIRARLGTAVVAGAETFRLDLAGDGMLSLEVTDSVRRTANGNAALVTNSGVIEAQGGQVILSAHAASGLVESVVRNTGRVAGRNVTVTGQGGNVDIAAGSVTSRGGNVSITAPDATVVVGPQARVSASSRQGGGQVQLGGGTTAAVRVEGRVSARGTGAAATGGRVAVQARDSVTLAPTAVVNASGSAGGGTVLLGTTGVGRAQTMARETRVESGAVVRADATANGAGGTIVVNSTSSTVMTGSLSARGGATGGDGGFVEVSGIGQLTLDMSRVDVRAPLGRAGTLLIDPTTLTIVASPGGDNIPGGGVINGGDATPPGPTINAESIRTFNGAVVLEATHAITVNAAIDTTIVASAGPPAVAASTLTNLTLRTTDAGGAGIAVNAPITLTAGTLTLTSASIAGNSIAVGAALNATSINLSAAGGIAGAGVVTTAGTLTVRGAAGGATEAASLSLTGANAIATLDARTTGNILVNNAGALTVAQAAASGAASEVTLTATSGTLSLPATGVISTGAGGTVTLAADVMSFTAGGVINPSATGHVVLTPQANDTGISVGGAGGLVLDPAALREALFTTGGNRRIETLQLRTTGTGTLAINTALNAGDGVATGANTLELIGNAIALNATVTGANNGRVRLFSEAGLTGASGVTLGGTGAIEILPRTNGGNITLGAAGAFVETAQIALMNAQTLVIGGMALSRLGDAGPINTGNITIAGDVTPNASVTTLRLRAGGSVTQTGGVVTAPNLSGYANGGAFTLSTGGVTPTANVITAIVADGAAGSSGIAASGDLRIDTNVALLTVNAPLRSGTRERDATTGAALGSAVITTGTTLSLFADDLALAARVTAPGGAIQLQGFTSGRNVTLGAAGAGTLSLDATDLGNLGEAANPATVLRLGRAHASGATHNIGSIAVDGAVNLGTRIAHLELLAGTDTSARSVSGTGVITVASLSAIAGGNVSLTGDNIATTLAPVSDTGAGTRTNAGNVSLWSGIANATAGSGTPGLLSFRNAADLVVSGSVLASGANALTLTTTAGGTLTINANAWVAAEAGVLRVSAAGALANAGTIAAAPIADNVNATVGVPGSRVASGSGGSNTGTIALGFNATTNTEISGVATNTAGLMIADTVTGLTTNSGTASRAGIVMTTNGLNIATNDDFGLIVGSISRSGATFTNRGTVVGSVLAGTIINEAGPPAAPARILGATVVADTGDITSNGIILAGSLRGQTGVTHAAGEIGAGGGSVTGTFSLASADARSGALTLGTPPDATLMVNESRTGSLTVEATTGNILQSGGSFTAPTAQSITFTARAGDVTQTGGVITAPRIAASAATSVTLDRAGNTFGTIIPWTAPPQLGAGTAAAGIVALNNAPGFGDPLAPTAIYGIAAGTAAVTLQTSASSLTVLADAGIRAGTDLSVRLNAANALLTLNAPLRSGTAGGGNSVLTLQSDRMALNAVAGSMTLAAPGGTVRLRTESAGRAINLGGAGTDPAGSLDLGAAELTRIGGLGADGLTTPAARLRIGADAAGAITVTGDVILRNGAVGVDGAFQSRVGTLELVSGSSVTQNATTSISVSGIAGRAGTGEFTLHDRAAHAAASLNAIDRVVAGTEDGTLTTNGAPRDNLTAGTDFALTTRRSLSVETPVTALGDAFLRVAPGTDDGVLTVNSAITVGSGRAMTLVADSMAIGADVIAPGGSIRVMPFSAARDVTLGAELAGTLSLSPTELGFFGAGATAATVLRIGRVSPVADSGALYTALNANTVGNIVIAAPAVAAAISVDLGTRIGALELFANSTGGTITTQTIAGPPDRVGAINVASLAGMAGGAIALTGANTIGKLAGITDGAPYVIATPFTDAGGAIVGLSIANTSLWAGAGNARGGSPASGLAFNNAGNLSVEGSVLNSGAGNLALTTTAGSNGNITVNATRWVAAENGTVTVTAGGTGILDNSGVIMSGSLSGGSVTSGGVGFNRATGTIALGNPAGAATSVIAKIGSNAAAGFLYAKTITDLITNNGLILVGDVGSGAVGTTRIGGLTSAGAVNNTGTIVGNVQVLSLTNSGTILGDTVVATGGNIANDLGRIVTRAIRASGDVTSSGDIVAGTGSASVDFTASAAIVRVGAITPGAAPTPVITTTEARSGDLSIQAGGSIIQTAGTITAGNGLAIGAGNAATDGTAVRSITLTAGLGPYGNNDIIQTGGVIRRTDDTVGNLQLAASAGREIRLNQAGNTFNEIVGWAAQTFAGPPTLTATASALPALTGAPTMVSYGIGAGGDVTLRTSATTLTVNANIRAGGGTATVQRDATNTADVSVTGRGTALTIRADDLAINAAIDGIRVADRTGAGAPVANATPSTLLLTRNAAGGVLVVGTPTAGETTTGALALSAAEVAQLYGSRVQFGEATGSTLSAIRIGANADFRTGGVRANELRFVTTGDVTQDNDTAINVERLSGRIGRDLTLGSLQAGTFAALNRFEIASDLVAGRDMLLVTGSAAGLSIGPDLRGPGGVAPLPADRIGVQVGDGRLLTILADDLALTELAPAGTAPLTIQAPNGVIRIMPVTAGRNISLGADAAGELALNATELLLIGGGGLGGTDTPAARLRIGADLALNGNPTGAIAVRGDVILRNGADGVDGAFQSRVGTLELVSASNVTQGATTSISVERIAGRAGGQFTLHDQAAHGAASLNAIDRIVAGTEDGTLTTTGAIRNLTAGTDFALTTRRSLSVETPVTATAGDAFLRVAAATTDGVLTTSQAITVGTGRALTLVADDMSIGANLVAPTGSIRVMPFTANRDVNLGTNVEGALSLNAAELAFFGAGGTAANVLRIGRVSPLADAGTLYTALNGNTVGNITVAGPVDVRSRLDRLELFANSASGTITGGGVINVGTLAAMAGGALSLTGANTVTTLGGITDGAPYVIAAPFLDNAGAILTRSIGETALWAGAGNAQGSGPVAGGLTFNNAGNLTVAGSLLSSGAGNLALTTTAGSNGNITVNATRWVAAENGTVTVTAGGTGILSNSGSIVSGSLSGGSVTSGGAGVNLAGGVIALGSPAGTSTISGITTNSGLLYAKNISGLAANTAAGRVWTQRDGSTELGTIGMTGAATNAGIMVGAVSGADAFTNQNNAWVVGSLSAGSVTNNAGGTIAATSVTATSGDVSNGGTINATEVRATRDVINDGTIQAGGGSATFTLTIPAASSGSVNAARVREGAIRALAPSFSITPTASLDNILTVSAGRDVTNTTNGLMTATARVNLHADGAISGNGRVVAPLLVVRGAAGGETRAGSFGMTRRENSVQVFDARSNREQGPASERLIFGQGGSFSVTQADAGNGNVTLRSDGSITRTAGVTTGVVADLLTVRGAAGGTTRAESLNLTAGTVTTGNAIQRLDARTNLSATANAEKLTYGQAGGFAVTQADAGAGNVTLRTDGAITRSAGVTTGVVGNLLTLRGATGEATTRVQSLDLTDGTLTTGNAITSLDARTSGALTYGQVGNLAIAQLDTGTGNATLRSDGAITNTGLLSTALLTVRGAAGGSTAAESLALTGANPIGALDVLVRGTLGLSLGIGASIQQLGSSAGTVEVTANGTLAVTGPVTAALDMTLRTTSGDIGIVPGGTLSGGRTTTLNAAGDILQSGGSLSAGTALFLTAGQDAIQTGGTTSAASLGSGTQGVSAGRDFLWNGGNVTLPTVNTVTAGRDLGLRTTGGATTVLGGLTAGRNLTVETTAGALTMQGNTVRASGGTLDLRSAGNLGVFGATLSAGGAMTLRATGSLTSNPSSFTAENISLVSGAGLSFSQGTLTATQNLTAEVAGDIAFQNSTLSASTNPADNAAAFRVLRLSATGNLSVRNSIVTADRVEFVAGGGMTTAASRFELGTGLLLSARGGVGQANEAPTTVATRNTNRLPLVIYDTRSGIFLTRLPDLLTGATTDQPGRSFNTQIWQVPQVSATPGQLFFGVNDGAPAAPTNAVAGAVLINLNAGSSPVFMLLNGGTASGSITAARLGVYGLPGTTPLSDGRAFNLFGTLSGIGGEGAARFGILGSATGTQPSPRALDLYRFNNCVISSVNCVVPTFLQIPTIPLVNSVILGVQQPGFDDRDVLLPNVAEKDF